MAEIASSQNRLGNVVKFEDRPEWGICRTKNATVLTTATMQIGSVVKSDGDTTYSHVADADVATLPADVGIVIDERIYEDATGDREITIMNLPNVNCVAGIALEQLHYADAVTAPNQVIVQDALKALGFVLLPQV